MCYDCDIPPNALSRNSECGTYWLDFSSMCFSHTTTNFIN